MTGKAWKVFSIALCFNLIAVSLYLYALITIQQKSQDASTLTADIATLTAQKENLRSVQKNVADTFLVRNELDGYFIPQDGVVQFLNLLQSLGTEKHLTLKVTSVGIDAAPLSPDMLEEVVANLEISGAWSDVSNFAALVELMPYKVYIKSVDLEKDGLSIPSWKGLLTIGVLKLK